MTDNEIAAKILERAARMYCNELVSACRHALSHLEGTKCELCDEWLKRKP